MALPNPMDNPPRAKVQDNPKKGFHYARVVGIADLGVQPEYVYQNEKQPAAPQIEFTFELPNSLMADGRPHWVSKKVKVGWNVSDSDPAFTSGLMRIVLAVNPEEETLDSQILDRVLNGICQVTTGISDKGYSTVDSVAGVPDGTMVPTLVNPAFKFDWDTATKADFDAIRSPMTRKRIQGADNYPTSQLKARIEGTLPAVNQEDLPF